MSSAISTCPGASITAVSTVSAQFDTMPLLDGRIVGHRFVGCAYTYTWTGWETKIMILLVSLSVLTNLVFFPSSFPLEVGRCAIVLMNSLGSSGLWACPDCTDRPALDVVCTPTRRMPVLFSAEARERKTENNIPQATGSVPSFLFLGIVLPLNGFLPEKGLR